MAEITITAPDAWVAAVGPDIVARVGEIHTIPFCQKVLTAWGTTFEAMTVPQKVQLFCLFSMWEERSRRRSEEAIGTAGGLAVQDTINEFEP